MENTIITDRRDWSVHPPYLSPGYASTVLRAPTQDLIPLPKNLANLSGPVFGFENLAPFDNDLTKNGRVNGEPLGERITVSGRVLDQFGNPVKNTLIEIWQANAAGRYIHKVDQHEAPLDPNFLGSGRCLTDENGHYTFQTIKPGSYPWGNHYNAWRPNHIHFSLFGANITSRLVTQMYFPGDPLLQYDPIYLEVPAKNREAMISSFDLSLTQPNFALGYRFDIVLRGDKQTPFEKI
jgi:protocatechuate 3,4-dioxygenase, beta subunit